MISEKAFIQNHPSFWKTLFPLANIFMRGIQLECKQKQNDLDMYTKGRRFSFVSQIGFMVFVHCIKDARLHFPQNEIKKEAPWYEEIEMLCITQFRLFEDDDDTIRAPLNNDEFEDAKKLSLRLLERFENKKKNILIYPEFAGCGWLDTCYGDIVVENTIYEIKSVNRNYNISDYRQLMVYCALNHLSKQHNIQTIALYNPRKDILCTHKLEDFASAISGATFNDLCWEIINYIGSEDTSK